MRQQPGEVEAVDPFHFHHADAAAVHPIVNVEQIVLLDLRHAGGDLGHPAHRLVVRPLVFVAFGREDLQRDRQREVVGSAPLGQIDHPLPARAQQAQQPMVLGPAQPLLFEDLLVAAEQFVGAADLVGAADQRCSQNAVGICDVKHRRDVQPVRLDIEPHRRRVIDCVEDEIAMRQHRTFRPPSGAAGVIDAGEIVAPAAGIGRRLGGVENFLIVAKICRPITFAQIDDFAQRRARCGQSLVQMQKILIDKEQAGSGIP